MTAHSRLSMANLRRTEKERLMWGQPAQQQPNVPSLLGIDKIRVDGGTQSRAMLDEQTVKDYAEAMKAGDVFPPVSVCFDGTDYWLWDGFHRVAAACQNAQLTVLATIYQGTQKEAVLRACGANAKHGLRRTNADIRRAVERLLSDPEWASWSDREIARRCVCSHTLVARMRPEILTGNVASERTYLTRHGTQATMKTGKQTIPMPVKPAVPETASPALRSMVDAGLVSQSEAVQYAEKLAVVPAPVKNTAEKLASGSVEKLDILTRLHHNAGDESSGNTFGEIAATGGFHYGDEFENWCDFASASISEINAGLRSLSMHHASIQRDDVSAVRVYVYPGDPQKTMIALKNVLPARMLEQLARQILGD